MGAGESDPHVTVRSRVRLYSELEPFLLLRPFANVIHVTKHGANPKTDRSAELRSQDRTQAMSLSTTRGPPLRSRHNSRTAQRKLASWWASPRCVGFVTLRARFWATTGTYERAAFAT